MNKIESQTMRNLRHVNLMSLKDIQLEEAQEYSVEMEALVRTLVHAVWYYQEACEGDEKAIEDIQKALAATPAKFISFMD